MPRLFNFSVYKENDDAAGFAPPLLLGRYRYEWRATLAAWLVRRSGVHAWVRSEKVWAFVQDGKIL